MRLYRRFFVVARALAVLARIFWQMGWGMWKITRLPQPCVSIFGSSRHGADFQRYRDLAAHIAHKLVHYDISVLTGGGPGIMEAANCGAHATPEHLYRTMKIAISGLPGAEAMNTCPGEQVMVDDFFTRKWLLFDHSIGFVIFPGGLGTMDELSDLVNLIACGKLKPRMIVLIGVEHWRYYTDFIDHGIQQGYIDRSWVPEMIVTDDIDEAVSSLITHCQSCELNTQDTRERKDT